MDNGMTITEERRVLTWSLHNLPEIYHLFQWNKREWMAQWPETYSNEILQEFYASYATSLQGQLISGPSP